MPAKRKGTSGSSSSRVKKPKTSDKYGAGKKKYSSKTSSSSSMEAVMRKLADAAVTKNINKTVETQWSEAMTVMKYRKQPSPTLFTGFDLVSLNQNWTAIPASVNSAGVAVPATYENLMVYHQMLVFNLSSLSQVKGQQAGSVSGWRQGYSINALALTISLTGEIQEIQGDCEIHIMVARRKDGIEAGGYLQPQLVNSDDMGLFKQLTDGPWGGFSHGFSAAVPDDQYISLMRRNTDAWTFPDKGHMSKKIFSSPSASSLTSNASVDMKMYFPLNTAWTFTSAAAVNPVLKGGDYYVFVWREGATDEQMEQNLRLYTKLTYKDA